ncbi:MAG: hypothetical protein U1F68_14850 [Gammaproteobacteria bacterium]
MTITIVKDGRMWAWHVYQAGRLITGGWVAGSRGDAKREAKAAIAALKTRTAA